MVEGQVKGKLRPLVTLFSFEGDPDLLTQKSNRMQLKVFQRIGQRNKNCTYFPPWVTAAISVSKHEDIRRSTLSAIS